MSCYEQVVKKKLHDEEINLKRFERESSRMRVRRQEFRRNIDDVCSENTAAANAPRLEVVNQKSFRQL